MWKTDIEKLPSKLHNFLMYQQGMDDVRSRVVPQIYIWKQPKLKMQLRLKPSPGAPQVG